MERGYLVAIAVAVALALLVVGVFFTISSRPEKATPQTTTSPAKLEKLVIVGPPGPLTVPLAYIKEKGLLSSVAKEVIIETWENPDKLKAMISSGSADIIVMPTCTAALMYNRGFKVKFIGVCTWGILYLISDNPDVHNLRDIRGAEVAVPFRGSSPDAMFRMLCRAEGLDPDEDFKVIYGATPLQVAQMILSGKVHYAVVPEPLATAVLLKAKAMNKTLYRVIDFSEAVEEEVGIKTPIAGAVAMPSVQGKPWVIKAFLDAWKEAVEWTREHPGEAGKLAEKYLAKYGIKAKPMELAVKNIKWRYMPSWEAKRYLEEYYEKLLEVCPDLIGGKLPDEGFYYELPRSG